MAERIEGFHPILNRELYRTVERNDDEVDRVKLLVARGADPAYRNEYGSNAIMSAVVANQTAIIEYLLSLPRDHPANVDIYGHTALTWAVFNGNYDVTTLLLEDGRCDPTVFDRWDNTAIKRVATGNHVRIVELLLSDMRVVKALRTADCVPPAVVERAIARNAWRRRRAVVCAATLALSSVSDGRGKGRRSKKSGGGRERRRL